jgi:tRNA pseudouridine32 synthase/23S rRNA pseudouridine746 synthase
MKAYRQDGSAYNPPPDTGLSVLHADAHLLVIDKPAGLLSVPGRTDDLQDCLETRVRRRFPEALLVHRLDRDTSGVFIMAMTPAVQRHLGLQFERRKLSKTYQALVDGVLDQDNGEIDLPLVADWPNRPLQKICQATGKPALTRWRVLERRDPHTRVELAPFTGRSHQLRVHMQALGHPILGDPLYGNAASADRLMLHATALTLHHPADGSVITYNSPPPF